MLKNWLVKTQQIKKGLKGFLNHTNYLKDQNRISHQNSKIEILHNGSKNIIEEFDNRKLYRKENGLRGGSVNNLATSFIVSLPTDIKQPTKDQWKQIGLYGIKKIAQANNIDYQELKKISHIVLHDESNSKNKPSHIHILISNIHDNKVIKGITQFKSTHAIKKSVNYSVKQLLKEDNNEYVPQKSKVGKKPPHIIKIEKMEMILNNFNDFKLSINSWLKDVFNKKNAYLSSKKAANNFNKFDNNIGDRLPEKILKEIEEVEEFEKPDHLKQNLKVTPKTNRKRRRRRN